ncbi:uncharacterized protein LOC131226891 [Magnolia sinica]|uniref:uncharacterized protein LOC131226891 n=1 Tax=Magnolia sinica TaxID=86752 RepID=UPI002658100C|nr:uncharacterized protein LOC131226891 [Magnolia sinica]
MDGVDFTKTSGWAPPSILAHELPAKSQEIRVRRDRRRIRKSERDRHLQRDRRRERERDAHLQRDRRRERETHTHTLAERKTRRKKNLSHMKRSSNKERRRMRRNDEKKEAEQVQKERMPKDLEEIQQENTNLGDMEDIFEITTSKKTEIVEYRPWPYLPIDILELIALRLFRSDFVHLTSSCKSWRSIAPLSLITERHLSLLTSRGLPFLRNHSPWLMYFRKDDGMCNFLDPLYNERYFINIPELSGSTNCFCKDGWVFMHRGNHSVFLFNPFIKARIELPDMNYDQFNCITFSSTPTSSDSTIIALECITTSLKICICRREDRY